MGWRAIRVALERDGLMKAQARALIEAAAGTTLNVMFPMVSEPWEFDQARAIFEKQREFLIARGKRIPVSYTHLDVYKRQELAWLAAANHDLRRPCLGADREY